MTSGLLRMGHAFAGAMLTALCGLATFLPVLAAEAPSTVAPLSLDLSAPGVSFAGFVVPK